MILSEVRAARIKRIRTGIGEFDRVLGGDKQSGIVPGSLVLLGGSPGIGKSTLVGAALGNLVGAGESVLYVSGEESAEQIRMRHERIGGHALEVPVIAETDLDAVMATIDSVRPAVCVIDSVQTLYCSDLTGAPGSVGQVREVAARLMQLAKTRDIAMLLVGHVTKEGSLAGPRVLEHLVDCVLQFEGERERSFRTLRAAKNRFGSTNEVGVFEMEGNGPRRDRRRVGALRRRRDRQSRVGRALLRWRARARCSSRFRRWLRAPTSCRRAAIANGIDRNRLALVLAVLSRHARVNLSSHDVFVNVVGGVRVDEPAADLAIAIAVTSAARGIALARDGKPLACFGEIGLTGELRAGSAARSPRGRGREVRPGTARRARRSAAIRAAHAASARRWRRHSTGPQAPPEVESLA